MSEAVHFFSSASAVRDGLSEAEFFVAKAAQESPEFHTGTPVFP
jgi:hypothetical protein